MTNSKEDSELKLDYNAVYSEFVKETDVIEKFNIFLKLHCGDDYSHLIDTDDNAGELMRQAINSLYITKEGSDRRVLEARIDQVMKDFVSLNVYDIDADESVLIQWRDDSLAELRELLNGDKE